MATFDRALVDLVRVVEAAPDRKSLNKICVVRDYRGALRLVVSTISTTSFDVARLSNAIAKELGRFFVGPILVLRSGGPVGERKVAQEILNRAEPWPEVEGLIPGVVSATWFKHEARLSKLAWQATGGQVDPWPLVPGGPFVASFYSFKGGVGRTTLLVACALELVKRGKRVAVVDLDIEAPGIGPLLEVLGGHSVLDLLVDHAVLQQLPPLAVAKPSAAWDMTGGVPGGRIDVVPAGDLNPSFLEKLARLDFEGGLPSATARNRPVVAALKALLAQLEVAPYDAILIDSRTGLHDIAGLALNALSHVDVFVSRGLDLDVTALEFVLAAWAKPRADSSRRPIIVQSLLAGDNDTRKSRQEVFRDTCYDIFVRLGLYPSVGAPPADAVGARHHPLPVRLSLALLESAKPGPSDFAAPEYVAIVDRLLELASP